MNKLFYNLIITTMYALYYHTESPDRATTYSADVRYYDSYDDAVADMKEEIIQACAEEEQEANDDEEFVNFQTTVAWLNENLSWSEIEVNDWPDREIDYSKVFLFRSDKEYTWEIEEVVANADHSYNFTYSD